MKIKHIFLLYFLVGFSIFSQIQAQKKSKVEIIHSDHLNMLTKKKLHILTGNVKLIHNDMVMTCDSLYQYTDTNYIEAFGNVHAVQNDTLNLYGDYLSYDGDSQFTEVRGNVILKDHDVTLETNFLDYDAATKVGTYYNNGKLYDEVSTLTSKIGYYFVDSRLSYFKDSVRLKTPEYRLVGDTMTYHTLHKTATIVGPTHIYGDQRILYSEDGWYNSLTAHAELYKNNWMDYNTYHGKADTIILDSLSGTAEMFQNLFLQDTINNIEVVGHYGKVEQNNDYAFVTDSALMSIIGQQDTLFVHSDTLAVIQDSAQQNILMGLNHTKFFNRELQGICDSLIYVTKDSTVYLRQDPIVWASGNQMTADKIRMEIKNNEVDKFYLTDKAMIVNNPKPDLYNQIKGREIIGFMRQNEIYKIDVNGSGEVLYYPDDKGAIVGMSKIMCSDIRIYLVDRKIKDIVFLNKPEGTTTPLFMVNIAEAKLRDFRWEPERRPKKMEDIFIKEKPQFVIPPDLPVDKIIEEVKETVKEIVE